MLFGLLDPCPPSNATRLPGGYHAEPVGTMKDAAMPCFSRRAGDGSSPGDPSPRDPRAGAALTVSRQHGISAVRREIVFDPEAREFAVHVPDVGASRDDLLADVAAPRHVDRIGRRAPQGQG